jgi:predicted phosphodiesterase
MKIHLLSDLYLEFYKNINTLQDFIKEVPKLDKNFIDIEDRNNKILILAGDIGYPTMNNYWNFLEDCCKTYNKVICVAGNHEYYNRNDTYNENDIKTMNEINQIIKENSDNLHNKYNNFYYLQNESITIDGIKFIGSILWSRIDKKYWNEIQCTINDYNLIYEDTDKLYTPETNNKLFEENLNYLIKEIKNTNKNQSIIIITHHLPSFNLIDYKYKKYNVINQAFATNLENYILQYPNIILWCCDHSHKPNEYKLNSSLLVMNPIGYKKENKYNNIRKIEILEGILF